MELIIADENGKELGSLTIGHSLDLDIGDTDDFELTVALSDWQTLGYGSGVRIYIPGTEYGGIASNLSVAEGSDQITLSGDTWRGMLKKKIIEPPQGEDYRTVSGDANTIIGQMVSGAFAGMFVAPEIPSGIIVNAYSFDRYTDLLSGLKKMLAAQGARLRLEYNQGEAGGSGFVLISAVPVEDYSELLEYSQDTGISFVAQEVNNGINHLICLGQGDLKDREVIHLYVQEDGSIGETPYYTDARERTATYDYGNVESLEELRKSGTERLESLKDYQSFEIDLDEIVAEVGDIVGGREYSTGLFIRQEITNKIVRVDNGDMSIDYKTGGIVKVPQPVGGGNLTNDKKEEITQAAEDAAEAIEKVIAVEGEFDTLSADYAGFKAVTAESLTAVTAKVGELEASQLTVEQADMKYATIEALTAQTARIGTLEATTVKTEYLETNYLTIRQIEAKYATIEALTAQSAQITSLESDTADIKVLLAGNITAENIKAGSISTDRLAAETGWITTAMIATGAIDTAQIADGSITDAKIVELTASKITSGRLDAAVIEVVNLNAANITVGTINGQQIAPGAIDMDNLAQEAVGSGNIAPDAVTTDKIAAGAVAAKHISANAVTADKIVSGAVTADKIAAKTITANQIAANAITSEKIAANSITTNKLAVDAIKSNNYAAGSTGSFLNLSDGSFDSPNLKWDKTGKLTASNGVFTGNVTANQIEIDNSIYMWAKGFYTSSKVEMIYMNLADSGAGTRHYELVIGRGRNEKLGSTQNENLQFARVRIPAGLVVGSTDIESAISTINSGLAQKMPISGGTFTGAVNIGTGKRVRLFEDGEGGNISIFSPKNRQWQMDAYNENFRIYTANGAQYVYIDTEGSFHASKDLYGSGIYASWGIQVPTGTAGLMFSSAGKIWCTGAQHLYFRSSSESSYFLHLGVHDGRWALDPDVGGNLSLGTANHRWTQLFATTASINTSDRNLKNSIQALDDRYLRLFEKLKPVAYKFNDGTSGRTHTGFISQDIEEAMNEVGLSANEFAAFCKDPKTERVKLATKIDDVSGQPEDVYEDIPVEGEYTYALRYEEFIALNTLAIQKLFKRVAALETKN